MGGRKETVSDSEILQVLEESEDPFLTTEDLREHIGFSNDHMNRRMRKLADHGLADRKKAGGVNIWWITDSGSAYLEEEP